MASKRAAKILSLVFAIRNCGAELSATEQLYVAVPSNATASVNLKFITSEPHVAGTDGDAKMAAYVQDQFIAAGIEDVETWSLTVGLNYPVAQPRVALVDPTTGAVSFEAALSEDVIAEDSTSDTWWRNHTFNGYSPTGTAKAPAVYANYGRPEDFDALADAGVEVSGKVVIVRYGECFRGLKAMNAQQRGAVATLIYSDPVDDGYDKGEVWPEGPWRPGSGVQRGSAQFLSLCAGDPFRADARYGAETTESLCSYHPNETIPSIPVLPLSYDDATPILASLGGPSAPADFVGGIDGLDYTLGPSELLLEVDVDNGEMVTTPIWNVVATIPGTLPEELDQPVLLGNHRDAWVFGAADPNSGTATIIEVARGLGALLAQGWKPLRTIKLLSWSGEEYGLLGSTGWGELNAQQLTRSAAYLNVDTAVSGDLLSVSATPALSTLWKDALDDLTATTTAAATTTSTTSTAATATTGATTGTNTTTSTSPLGVALRNGPHGSVKDSNTGREIFAAPLANIRERSSGKLRQRRSLKAAAAGKAVASTAVGADDNAADADVGTLGSGSDYTVFLDHLGIASLDFEFTPGGSYGVYHSIYDSFDWVNMVGGSEDQPGSSFTIMAAAARIWGVLALRLADTTLLPFDHAAEAKALAGYYAQLQEHRIEGLNLEGLAASISAYNEAQQQLTADVEALDETDVSAVNEMNERLSLTERRFLDAAGLPLRPWFKHTLQAPGLYLGYAAEAFPGVRQALDDGDLDLAQQQADVAAERVNAAAAFLAGRE